jgi:hypothetical protein
VTIQNNYVSPLRGRDHSSRLGSCFVSLLFRRHRKDLIIQSLMALHEVESMLAIWAVHYSKESDIVFHEDIEGT